MAVKDVEPERPVTEGEQAVTGGPAVGVSVPPPETRRRKRSAFLLAMTFVAPALVIVGAWVLYPILFTGWRSLYDARGTTFVGLDNYRDMFTRSETFTAIRNNAIWAIVAPSVITALGLVFAVLSERVRWSTAFKVAIFMPMAISALSAGVIWRLVYEERPEIGLLNAGMTGAVQLFDPSGGYPGARPSQEDAFGQQGQAFASTATFSPGDTAEIGLVGIPPAEAPEGAVEAQPPQAQDGAITGVVWLDFTRGGGGERGQIDPTELGLPGVEVEAVAGNSVVASATTDDAGRFVLEDPQATDVTLRLPASNFTQAFGGVTWLGPALVTPAIIAAFVWMTAGFATVTIGAGLAAIPRDVLEAARVDGANEWQVFRRVTVPLLTPVLAVVLVTLLIGVLKIFDIVIAIAPGSSQASANVIALEMFRQSFGGARNFGLGSALAIFLFILVVPAMLFNIRRFRAEQ